MIQMALDHDLAAVTNSLNSVQVILLMIMKCDEIMAVEQISKDTAMFGTELQEFLQPLFDQGYIRMHSEQNSTLCLTESGEQFFRANLGCCRTLRKAHFASVHPGRKTGVDNLPETNSNELPGNYQRVNHTVQGLVI